MSYAAGDGWTIDIVRHPVSGGYQVYIEERDYRPAMPATRTRIAGNALGYARRETAEKRAAREAERLESHP
jgi:hypothetical protein